MTREELLNDLASQIDGISREHPARVAIDGVDAAGKTTLADELVQPLQCRGRTVVRASIDGFHQPSGVRYRRGAMSPEGYYRDSFDYDGLIDSRLRPLGPRGSRTYRRAVFDFRSDSAIASPSEEADPDAVLLFDGVFLLHQQFCPSCREESGPTPRCRGRCIERLLRRSSRSARRGGWSLCSRADKEVRMTAQIPEWLVLDGEETSMAFCPPLPDGHPRIFEPGPDEGSTDPADLILSSTACWRGYRGTWEIKDGLLYLIALRGRLRIREGDPILGDWFSGVLRVPRGEELLYVHMGFGSVYEEEVHIKIEKGRVVATRVLDNRGKTHDGEAIGWSNLPGDENKFPGDDEF